MKETLRDLHFELKCYISLFSGANSDKQCKEILDIIKKIEAKIELKTQQLMDAGLITRHIN